MLYALPGDVFFTSGEGFLANAIRWAERIGNEPPTEVNHTGGVTKAGFLVPPFVDFDHVTLAEVSEALWRVENWVWWTNHNHQPSYTVELWRPRGILPVEVDRVVDYWVAQTGQRYGWWKLFAHLLDNKVLKGRRVFRRLLGLIHDRPICSFHVANGMALIGRRFGTDPDEATPDSMQDWLKANYTPSWQGDQDWMLVGRETINNDALQVVDGHLVLGKDAYRG